MVLVVCLDSFFKFLILGKIMKSAEPIKNLVHYLYD